MSELILIRTHFVDDRVDEMARRFAAGGDYYVMIAIDESAGEIDARSWPKLSLTLDSCVRLGLEVAFPKPLWRCGDYLFYHAFALGRDYRRYWSVEYDVVVNFADPLEFFRRLDREADEDYLTTLLEPAKPDWHWYKAAARRFPVVHASGFAVVRLSARAIPLLLARRRAERARLTSLGSDAAAQWVNDEAFVSSAAPELGLRSADFNKYGEFYAPDSLRREVLLHPAQVPAADGRLYHAVRDGAAYLNAVTSYYDFDLGAFFAWADSTLPAFGDAATPLLAAALADVPDDPAAVFGPTGAFAAILPCFKSEPAAAALLRALALRRMRLCLEAVQCDRLGLAIAHAPGMNNVGLGRAAWQSSTSPRARRRDPRQDAEGGNDGDVDVEYGFHTAFQDEPWWAVDLGQSYPLRRVRIFNRSLSENRLRGFVVELSEDFVNWRAAYAHDPDDRRALLARPIEIEIAPPLVARYLRVRLPRRGVLHLAEVEAIRA